MSKRDFKIVIYLVILVSSINM
uniref:Uncharacterized protein n=1 Tax=Rhizophora mucronata TaxID=61149 RepID=A0A2P2NA51_RHIMU